MSSEKIINTDASRMMDQKTCKEECNDFRQALNNLTCNVSIDVVKDGIDVTLLRPEILRSIPGVYRKNIRMLRWLPSTAVFDKVVSSSIDQHIVIPCVSVDGLKEVYLLIDWLSREDFRRWLVICESSTKVEDVLEKEIDVKDDNIREEIHSLSANDSANYNNMKDESIISSKPMEDGSIEMYPVSTEDIIHNIHAMDCNLENALLDASIDSSMDSNRDNNVVIENIPDEIASIPMIRRSQRKNIRTTAYATPSLKRGTNGFSLQNVGNTCFLNVCIQQLTHCPQLFRAMQQSQGDVPIYQHITALIENSNIYNTDPSVILCEHVLDQSVLFEQQSLLFGYELGRQEDVLELLGGVLNLSPLDTVCKEVQCIIKTKYQCTNCTFSKELTDQQLWLALNIPAREPVVRKRKATTEAKKGSKSIKSTRLSRKERSQEEEEQDVHSISSNSSNEEVQQKQEEHRIVDLVSDTMNDDSTHKSVEHVNVDDSNDSGVIVDNESSPNPNENLTDKTTTTGANKVFVADVSHLLSLWQQPTMSTTILCSSCQLPTLSTPYLSTLPNILILPIQRVKYNFTKKCNLQKITDTVRGVLRITVQEQIYYLGGVICHKGTSLQSGHYYIDINLHAMEALAVKNEFYLARNQNSVITKLLEQELQWNNTLKDKQEEETDTEFKQRITRIKAQCAEYLAILSRDMTVQDCHWVRCNDDRVDFLDTKEIIVGPNQKDTYIYWYYKEDLLLKPAPLPHD